MRMKMANFCIGPFPLRMLVYLREPVQSWQRVHRTLDGKTDRLKWVNAICKLPFALNSVWSAQAAKLERVLTGAKWTTWSRYLYVTRYSFHQSPGAVFLRLLLCIELKDLSDFPNIDEMCIFDWKLESILKANVWTVQFSILPINFGGLFTVWQGDSIAVWYLNCRIL